MSGSGRSPRSKRKLKRVVLRELIDRGYVKPQKAVPPGRVKSWFPRHERGPAVVALIEMVSGSPPVEWRTIGRDVWVTDSRMVDRFDDEHSDHESPLMPGWASKRDTTDGG